MSTKIRMLSCVISMVFILSIPVSIHAEQNEEFVESKVEVSVNQESFLDIEPVVIELVSDGNIYEKTGVKPMLYDDGVDVKSFEDSALAIDRFMKTFQFSEKDVIGYTIMGTTEIVLLRTNRDTVAEYMFQDGEVFEFNLSLETKGSWTSEDGTVTMSISDLTFYGPASDNKKEDFRLLSIRQYYYSYTQSYAGLSCSYVAAVEAWLDTSAWDFIAVIDCCYEVPSLSFWTDWENSDAADQGEEGWAGGDAEFCQLLNIDYIYFIFHEQHGAWVTITLGGATNHGGYSDSWWTLW
ncbi:MAG: hypothetical protein P3T54_02015 [Dehalogenimonas sp.]|uniref:Uncharacterized protein n=1 Tax=Candidatus Dehalogenimonas loeffleri TaxID=3127115 RepID=A0ABZ2J593_9CHLR|nr:hypothetical protein [Dehalogenimonas sp.]